MHVVVVRDDGDAPWWVASNDGALVGVPKKHVTVEGAAALEATWSAALAGGAVNKVGPDPRVGYATCDAMDRIVRLVVKPGVVCVTLHSGHFTSVVAEGLSRVVEAMHAEFDRVSKVA